MGDGCEWLRKIERAAVRAWPALECADIHGWLWRYASGGSLRANSVSTLAFTGNDVDAAIAAAERSYRAKGAASRFTITQVSEPADLDRRLAALGYARGATAHATMVKEVARAPPAPREVALCAEPTAEWLAVYLAGLGADRRAVAPAILARLPQERIFLACVRAGRVVGSGLSIAEGGLASVQCMATRADARRQGCATAVLRAIEGWAAGQRCTHLYLQAELANAGAIALYATYGFQVAGRYHVRCKD
jgi:ribosomal protein S18 acetylase RimI-like enzyme